MFSITNVAPALPHYSEFLFIDNANRNLTVSSRKPVHVGDYDVTLRAYLKEFPTKYSEVTFTAYIRFCWLNSLTPPVINPRMYWVTEEKLEIAWSDFVQDPAECEHRVSYDYFLVDEDGNVRNLEDGDNLPDWLTMWNAGHRFEVLTDDDDYVGKYTIRVKAVIEDKYFATVPWA